MCLVLLLSCCGAIFVIILYYFIFFFKQKTAYEMRISDWSSDVCSSDLLQIGPVSAAAARAKPGMALCERRTAPGAQAGARLLFEIGRASCRERVCQYV